MCDYCQRVNVASLQKGKHELHCIPIPTTPWWQVGINLLHIEGNPGVSIFTNSCRPLHQVGETHPCVDKEHVRGCWSHQYPPFLQVWCTEHPYHWSVQRICEPSLQVPACDDWGWTLCHECISPSSKWSCRASESHYCGSIEKKPYLSRRTGWMPSLICIWLSMGLWTQALVTPPFSSCLGGRWSLQLNLSTSFCQKVQMVICQILRSVHMYQPHWARYSEEFLLKGLFKIQDDLHDVAAVNIIISQAQMKKTMTWSLQTKLTWMRVMLSCIWTWRTGTGRGQGEGVIEGEVCDPLQAFKQKLSLEGLPGQQSMQSCSSCFPSQAVSWQRWSRWECLPATPLLGTIHKNYSLTHSMKNYLLVLRRGACNMVKFSHVWRTYQRQRDNFYPLHQKRLNLQRKQEMTENADPALWGRCPHQVFNLISRWPKCSPTYNYHPNQKEKEKTKPSSPPPPFLKEDSDESLPDLVDGPIGLTPPSQFCELPTQPTESQVIYHGELPTTTPKPPRRKLSHPKRRVDTWAKLLLEQKAKAALDSHPPALQAPVSPFCQTSQTCQIQLGDTWAKVHRFIWVVLTRD